MTAIDAVIEVWKVLNVQPVWDTGANLWQHNRPRNSQLIDVVISVSDYDTDQIDTGFIDVLVYAPNLESFYPLNSSTEDSTFPNLEKLKEVSDVVVQLLHAAGYDLDKAAIPVRDKDGQWYAHTRIKYLGINDVFGIPVSLIAILGNPDGYGGRNQVDSLTWEGLAGKENVGKGSQLNINAGRYEFNLTCDWLVPVDAAPQKNMHVVTNEGEYVITGIRQEGARWRLNAVRKDAAFQPDEPLTT